MGEIGYWIAAIVAEMAGELYAAQGGFGFPLQ
jgi:hypothetical protein